MNITITRNLFNALLIAVLLVSSLVLADLPAYSGPHGVGIIQLENAVQDPQTITDTKFKNSGHPAFRLDTVLITLFYPTDPGAKSSKPPSAWYPEPRDLVAQGVSIGLGGSVTPSFVQAALNLVAGNLSIPAQVDVSILSGGEILPVMIFSHGTFGMPEWYSQLCGEMASRGVVIASVTHRDGTAPATVVKFQNGTSYNLTAFTQDDVL